MPTKADLMSIAFEAGALDADRDYNGFPIHTVHLEEYPEEFVDSYEAGFEQRYAEINELVTIEAVGKLVR